MCPDARWTTNLVGCPCSNVANTLVWWFSTRRLITFQPFLWITFQFHHGILEPPMKTNLCHCQFVLMLSNIHFFLRPLLWRGSRFLWRGFYINPTNRKCRARDWWSSGVPSVGNLTRSRRLLTRIRDYSTPKEISLLASGCYIFLTGLELICRTWRLSNNRRLNLISETKNTSRNTLVAT